MSSAPSPQHLRDQFAQRFGRPCEVVARAPGRVNLIGEHTDYNEGFVLPMALEQSTWVAAAARDDGQVRAVALDVNDAQTWPVDDWNGQRRPDWTSYIAGVAALLRQRGAHLDGADVLVRSDVPVGGGLSSSAALEVAVAKALIHVAGEAIQSTEVADLCRMAEHKFAGVPCGIMDQFVSLLARAGCAFLLDCRARTWDHVPLRLGDYVVLVVDSGVKHKLATGEYAVRQRQCQQAVAYLQRVNPGVRALRDVDAATVRAHATEMEPEAVARALHVTSENERTVAAAAALRRGDLPELGRLMAGSHRSLRDDYQVSCRELDLLVDIVSAVPGVLGARMTGGGFGGCIVAIAHRASLPQIEAALRARYDAAGLGPARTLRSHAGAGASIEYS
jgi:galactokinase